MNKVVDLPSPDAIEAQACAWISQLDGDQPPSPDDMDALREWVSRSPLHRQELARLAELWGNLNILTELSISLNEVEPVRSHNPFSVLLSPASLCMVLTALLLAAVGVVYWPAMLQQTIIEEQAPLQRMYSTQVGEQHLATLPDGSVVRLNTDSQVEIDYSDQRRKITLLKGEAHFEVTHDPGRPFEVYAGTGLVRAVGTAFSVYLLDQQVEVTVTEGRVELVSAVATNAGQDKALINQPRKSVQHASTSTLDAGQTTRFNHTVETIQTLKEDEVARKLSWREGMLVFSGENLDFVVQEVTRYTSMSIVITDPKIRDIRIGGYFKVGDTDAMFEVLESSFGIKVSRVNDELIHLSQLSAVNTEL